MSTSLPTRLVYNVTIPRVNDLEAVFNYNYFSPDENVNDTGAVSNKFLVRQADAIDSSFLQFASTRVPRMVVITWTLPLPPRNNLQNSSEQRGSLIADNIAKVVVEDSISLNEFSSLTFHDGDIQTKSYNYVSGSQALNTLLSQASPNVSPASAAASLNSLTPNNVSQNFIANSLVSAPGASFYDDNGSPAGGNTYFRSLSNVAFSTQVNNRVLKGLVDGITSGPNSPYSSDVVGLLNYVKQIDTLAHNQFSLSISEDDYKTFVPYYDLQVVPAATHKDSLIPEIVGYIIDKLEVLPSGHTIQHSSIIIDNPHVATTVDFAVKYNTTYTYAIRTVMSFTIPAIDGDTGQLAFIKSLFSSKQSNKVYVNTVDMQAPPPPTDFEPRWDYKNDNLVLAWTFPPNPQRDIKKFQVFRRSSIKLPFELIKMYDFNDSIIKMPNLENPNMQLVETVSSPYNTYTDPDFVKSVYTSERKSMIYAIAAVDAHGLTSCYSMQFVVWFDQFKNVLQKKLISHLGAPKAYPNMYLQQDAFVDTIRVNGPNATRANLYFNPQYYYVTDAAGTLTPAYVTKQTGGSYKINFINLDNQKAKVMTVLLDDQTSMAQSFTNASTTFGSSAR